MINVGNIYKIWKKKSSIIWDQLNLNSCPIRLCINNLLFLLEINHRKMLIFNILKNSCLRRWKLRITIVIIILYLSIKSKKPMRLWIKISWKLKHHFHHNNKNNHNNNNNHNQLDKLDYHLDLVFTVLIHMRRLKIIIVF